MKQTALDELNVRLQELALYVRSAINDMRYQAACEGIFKVLELVPEHPVAVSDLAFVYSRMGQYERSYETLQQAIAINPDNSEIYDTAITVCGELHHYEEALYYARRSMALKLQQAAEKPVQKLPESAPPGLSTDPERNVIAYSLFGANPRYCETAVLNCGLAAEIYPQWRCRFYIDDSVPQEVVARLQAAGGRVVRVSDKQKEISGLFWRFAVADDDSVQCFMVRDADSLLSYKECAAVDEWLASGKWFHIMRDSVAHAELILAGMWGGYGGSITDMQGLIRRAYGDLQLHNKNIDQVFLRDMLYPTVAQSVCVHDKYCLDRKGLPFPDYRISEIERVPYFHIGMIDGQAATTTLQVGDDGAVQVRWTLLDENSVPVCSYETPVGADGKIVLSLPYRYSQRIRAQQWRFVTQTVSNIDVGQ